MKEETKELAKKQSNLPTAMQMEAWGGQVVTSNDILLAKILPLQFMSDKVKNKEGEYGEFRDTINNEKFGDLAAPFEVIPFYMEKKWVEHDIVTNKAGAKKREWKHAIPIQDNATKPGYNDNLPYVDPDGKVERDRRMDFYVLIPSEVEKGTALPYILSFQRTSLKAGKKLAMQMFIRNAQAGKIPAAVVMKISGKSVQNDNGEFVVQDVAPSREATDVEMQSAFEWLKRVRAGETKIDESDTKEEQGSERDVSAHVFKEDAF